MKSSLIDELLEKAFCDGYEYAQREFTRWDDTDDIKRMKDSDILAESYKKDNTSSKRAKSTLGGAGLGAGIGAAAGALFMPANRKLGAKLGAGIGALNGGMIGGMIGDKRTRKERKDTRFHNERLAYAKRQAARRERRDWKQQMTGREGYSY